MSFFTCVSRGTQCQFVHYWWQQVWSLGYAGARYCPVKGLPLFVTNKQSVGWQVELVWLSCPHQPFTQWWIILCNSSHKKWLYNSILSFIHLLVLFSETELFLLPAPVCILHTLWAHGCSSYYCAVIHNIHYYFLCSNDPKLGQWVFLKSGSYVLLMCLHHLLNNSLFSSTKCARLSRFSLTLVQPRRL